MKARPTINITGLIAVINRIHPRRNGTQIARRVRRRPIKLMMKPTSMQITAAPMFSIDVRNAHSEENGLLLRFWDEFCESILPSSLTWNPYSPSLIFDCKFDVQPGKKFINLSDEMIQIFHAFLTSLTSSCLKLPVKWRELWEKSYLELCPLKAIQVKLKRIWLQFAFKLCPQTYPKWHQNTVV